MQKHLESCTRKVPMTTDTPSASPVRTSVSYTHLDVYKRQTYEDLYQRDL